MITSLWPELSSSLPILPGLFEKLRAKLQRWVKDVERAARQYEAMFGTVAPDEKVTVLKQPEPVYHLSPRGVAILGLAEWSDGNEKAIQLLGRWFDLAVSRGLKPIVIESLKRVLDSEWTRSDVDQWLNRIERYSSCSEFVTDIMGLRGIA